jgi:hypothetical protein
MLKSKIRPISPIGPTLKALLALITITIFSFIETTYCTPKQSQVYTYELLLSKYTKEGNWYIPIDQDSITAGVIFIQRRDQTQMYWTNIEEYFPAATITWGKKLVTIHDPYKLLADYRINITVIY